MNTIAIDLIGCHTVIRNTIVLHFNSDKWIRRTKAVIEIDFIRIDNFGSELKKYAIAKNIGLRSVGFNRRLDNIQTNV